LDIYKKKELRLGISINPYTDEKNIIEILPYISNLLFMTVIPGKGGQSPLSRATDWVNLTFEGQKAKRETSTMPGAAASSWYFLRYIDPKNQNAIADEELLKH